MNDLFTRSWAVPQGTFSQLGKDGQPQDVEMGGPIPGTDLREFNIQVQSIERDIENAKQLVKKLELTHEQSKSMVKAQDVQLARESMSNDIGLVRRTALQVKEKIQKLEKDNENNRKLPHCERYSATDRARTSITVSLGNKLKDLVILFNTLSVKMEKEHRETVERRVYTVTGEKAGREQIDEIIETGKSEQIFQLAVQQQGRGKALDVLTEMQERHDAVNDLKKSLLELHQLFLDMATLVESQGELLDNIELQVDKANEFQQVATKQLVKAREIQKNTRKWKMYGVIICVVILIVLAVILYLVLRPA